MYMKAVFDPDVYAKSHDHPFYYFAYMILTEKKYLSLTWRPRNNLSFWCPSLLLLPDVVNTASPEIQRIVCQ